MLFLGAVTQYIRNRNEIMIVINTFIFGGVLFVFIIFLSNVHSILTGDILELKFGMTFTYVSFQTLCLLVWKIIYYQRYRFSNSFFAVFVMLLNIISGNKKVVILP